MLGAKGLLHSSRDPVREARRVAENILNELSSAAPGAKCVIVGCGWGYVVEEFLQLQAARESAAAANFTAIFYEPLASVADCLQARGRAAKLAEGGATILNAVADLRDALRGGSSATVFVTPAYRRLFPELETLLGESLQQTRAGASESGAGEAPRPRNQADQVDRATGGRFLRQWTRNALIRLRADQDGFEQAFERTDTDPSERTRAKAKPTLAFLNPAGGPGSPNAAAEPPTINARDVLYCGAGPGLLADLGLKSETQPGAASEARPESQSKALSESNARRLRALQQNYFIVAADTALAPLLHAGLKPDLAISIDSGPGTYYHLIAAAQRLQRRPLASKPEAGRRFDFPVLTNLAGPRCLALFFERCIYYRTSTPLDQWLALGPLADVPELNNPSRNALGLALHLARLLGSRRLLTAGANLKSVGHQTHVAGTGYTEYARERVHRLYSLEMYRPGGYRRRDGGSGRTQKNEIGFQSAERMAANFGIDLATSGFEAIARTQPAAENESGTTESASGGGKPGGLSESVLTSFSTAELRSFLQDTRPRLNEAVFADWQITPADLDRWFLILK